MSHIPQFTCSELHKSYQELLDLRREVGRVFREETEKRDFTQTKVLIKKIEEQISFLREHIYVSISRARKIMDSQEDREKGIINMFGPEEVEKSFGVKVNEENLPRIPFTRKELERAKELGEKLILRIPQIDFQLLQKIMERGIGGLRINPSALSAPDSAFSSLKTHAEWALVSDRPLQDLYDMTCLTQLRKLVDYLEHTVYTDQSLPEKYQKLIPEFKKGCEEKIMKFLEITDRELRQSSESEIEKRLELALNHHPKYRTELMLWIDAQPLVEAITPSPYEYFYDFCLRRLHAVTEEQKQSLGEAYKDYCCLFSPVSEYFIVAGGWKFGGTESLRFQGDWKVSDKGGLVSVCVSRT